MIFLQKTLEGFTRPEGMDARLRARLTPWELFALVLTAASIGLFIWAYTRVDYIPFDYSIYMQTVAGNLRQYYYADWILPLFGTWSKIPFWWGFALWDVLNLLCLFFAARIFGGNTTLTLLTFQVFYCLFLGQITGLLIGGLALGWWAMAHRRWILAGLGFFIASTKFQIGLPLGLLLWLTAEAHWRERLQVLLLPAILAGLSLILAPAWPVQLLERIQAVPPYDWGSISLWQWLGPAALLLWLPPLLLPLGRHRRFLALAAAIPLTVPYFQQADLPMLYVLPVGWLPVLLGNLGFLFFLYLFDVLRFLWVVPLAVYLSILLPAACSLIRQGFGRLQLPGRRPDSASRSSRKSVKKP